MGIIGWSPSEFWKATLADMMAAIEGVAIKNGAKPRISPEIDAELRRRLEDSRRENRVILARRVWADGGKEILRWQPLTKI